MCVSCHEKCKGAVEKAIVSFMPACMQIRLLCLMLYFILYCSPANKQMYKFAMYSFSLLLNSSTIENLLCHLFSIKALFDSSHVDEQVTQAHSRLCKAFENLGVHDKIDSNDDNDDDNDFVDASEIWEDKQEFIVDSKPFGRYFEERLKTIGCCRDDTCPPNQWYTPKFMETLMKNWLPTCPLWTSLLRGII